MLVLKQNAANTVPTPPAGKGTIFLTDNDDIAVKTNDGNVTTFPTVGGANTQVFFNDEGAIGGSANMTFNKSGNVLTVLGNVVATNVLTDNLKYANGANWDLQQPGGSNTQLQFNDADQFGGSANLTFNKTTNTLALLGTANISEINTTGNVLVGGNLTVNGNVTYINVDTLNVEDPIISLGGGPNGDPLTSDDGKDRGTALQYFSGGARTAFMGWDNSNAEFGMGAVTTIASDVVTFSSYGNLRVSYIIGNGSALSGITGGNVSGQVANALVAGTVYTNAQPNITSVGTLTSLLVGASASTADFPNAKVIVAQDNSGQTHSENIGLVGEAVADSGNTSTWGIGVLGEARANGATKATGVQGGAYVTNSADTGAAVGVRGYATMTHAGGYNIGVLGNAAGSGLGNYAFYVQAGNIASIETDTTWDLNDNSATALAFSSSGKANILRIDTTDSAEGVAMSGTLGVTGNLSAGNANLGNAATANFFIGSGANLTNLPAGNISGQVANALVAGTVYTAAQPNITSVGTLSSLAVTGNVTAGNVGGANLVSANFVAGTLTTNAQPNVTSVGTLTSLSVTGNVSAGNLSGTLISGTLETAAQPNITSVGTLTGLGVNGNITAANITANTGVFTGNAAGLTNIPSGNISGQVANALVAGTVYTNAQPNITSVGTLSSLAVTGNASAGNINAGNLLTANFVAGTLTTAAQPNITSVGTLSSLNVSGNANVGNIGAAAGIFTTVEGNLTTAAQPNITSVGTLSSLAVTGNVAAGNLTTTGVLSVTGTGTSSIAGNLDMTGNTIGNLAPPVASTDAATKQYVDDIAQGLHVHAPCYTATFNTLAVLTGGTITYNNGTAGVGANLVLSGSPTANFTAANTFDGNTTAIVGSRILVKNEANTAHNGIYVVDSATVLTRATDFDTPTEMAGGDFTFVQNGDNYNDTGWVMTDPVTTVGTSPVTFVQFSGAGTYQAGTGLTLTGSVFSVNASQSQITSVGTLTSLGVSGTITAANITANTGVFTGNGSGLSALVGANVTGTVANATFATSAGTAGTVTTNAQPNITSVGTLSSLAVTGNANVGNLGTAGLITATGNVSGGNLTTAGALSVTGTANITGHTRIGNVPAALTFYNPLICVGGEQTEGDANANTVASFFGNTAYAANTGAQIGIGGYYSATNLATFGSISAVKENGTDGNFAGALLLNTRTNGNGLTERVRVTSVGNVGIANSAPTHTLSVTGTMNVSGNANVGNLGTAQLLATANVTAPQLISNVSTGTAPLVVTSTTVVANLRAATSNVANTVNDAAQPNITSVGTLTSLAVTGNVTAGNVSVSAGTVTLGTLTTGANSTAGTVTGNWTLSAGSRWNATYADLAEKYVADADYEPGTVLVFGGEKEVSVTGMEGSTRVAGIVSTDPAYVMNAGCEGEHVVTLALMGRVPCKVEGNVRKGDLLVTSSVAGYAKVDNEAKAGTIIGKALQNFDGHHGVVEVVVGRV